MKNSPNILLIITHDTGRHFGSYGIPAVHTPAIDDLAEQGCRFTNYFAVAAKCSPSRAATMTGRYPQSNGVMGLVHDPWGWKYNEDERHLSHILRDVGYRTALFRLQHESIDVDRLGFDQRLAMGTKPGLKGRDAPLNAVETAEVVRHWLKDQPSAPGPFYAQIGFRETHAPFCTRGIEPDDSSGVYIPPYIEDTEAARQQFAHFQGAVRHVDAVQVVMDGLRDAGLEDDTVLIFTVDHGISFPRAKQTLYDAGIEIPLLIRWPDGGIEGGISCDQLLSNVDLVPTLLDLVGVSRPENLEGISFAQVFEHPDIPSPRQEIFALKTIENETMEARCVRTDRHKMILNFVPRQLVDVPVDLEHPSETASVPNIQLFDLEKDPGESENLFYDPHQNDVRRDLVNAIMGWLERVKDPVISRFMPTPYYRETMRLLRECR